MGYRIRHCVECPRCLVRYLVARSPYRNGSYLVPTVVGSLEEYMLYCACGKTPVRSHWKWSEVKTYGVSKTAYDRGYGTPEEVFPARRSGASPGGAGMHRSAVGSATSPRL